VDVKFIAPLSASSQKKYCQFTATGDCTRLRVLRIYDWLNQKTAIQFADFLLDKVPLPHRGAPDGQRIRISVGVRLAPWPTGASGTSTSSPPPRLNGRVERSHRIDGEEFYRQLRGVVIDDTHLFNDKLQEWQDFCSYHRPHGALGGQTPCERLRQKTTSTTPAVNDLRQLHNGGTAGELVYMEDSMILLTLRRSMLSSRAIAR